MEYIVVILLATVILVIFLTSFLRSAKKLPTGKLPQDSVKPPGKPSADEPTPAASSVASRSQVETARKHTPPA